ncbi:Nramp family divalent metal transporter [Planctobacterium marinum]
MRNFISLLGPGLVFAATSIGVSHVVQSTRAGADFGYALVAIIILAHVIKLPFFQAGPRYAAATGENLLDAYLRLGKGYYISVVLLTFATMFIIQAAVTIVAAGVLANILPFGWSIGVWSLVVLLASMLLLITGGYRLLKNLMKAMMLVFLVLCVTTLCASLLSDRPEQLATAPQLLSVSSIAFIVALVGWMPTAIEVSIWHSFWVVEQQKLDEVNASQLNSSGTAPIASKVKIRLLDFNIGYLFCCLLALLFVALGAQVLFGRGIPLQDSAIGFSAQLIAIFTDILGPWSKPVVSGLIFIAMFSTCIAVADGFSQVITRIAEQQFNLDGSKHKLAYHLCIPVIGIGGLAIILLFAGQLTSLVDFATTVSFLSAPWFAWLNMKSLTLPNMPVASRVTSGYNIYTQCCLACLSAFAIFYLAWRLF